MKIGVIYAQATSADVPVVPQSEGNPAEENAAAQLHLQTKLNWLKETRTQEVFTELLEQAKDLELQARTLAKTFHSHGNYLHIIKLLNDASTIRELITTYGNAN